MDCFPLRASGGEALDRSYCATKAAVIGLTGQLVNLA